MTDRVRTITVIMDQERRTDDTEVVMNAIAMIKGVAGVMLGEVTGGTEHMQRELAKSELRNEIWEILQPEWARKAAAKG